jgi:hypothetical protein
VRPGHLRGLLAQLLRLDAAQRPPGAASAATLLGSGDASLLPDAPRAAPPLPRWTRWPHTGAAMPHAQARLRCACSRILNP